MFVFIGVGVDDANKQVDEAMDGTMAYPDVHGVPGARCASLGDENLNCLNCKNSYLEIKLIKISYLSTCTYKVI